MTSKLLLIPALAALALPPGKLQGQPEHPRELPAAEIAAHREKALEKWAGALASFKEEDRALQPHPDTILFIGSSSFRLWTAMPEDLAPYRAINRGFGGARWPHLAPLIDDILADHQFRAVVFFIANDIRGKEDDISPAQSAVLISHTAARVRAKNPGAHLFFIAVTPCEKRIALWPQIQGTNAAAKDIFANIPKATYIATQDLFLNHDGKPKPELFVDDQLHLNQDGYALWTKRIRHHLDQVFPGQGK